MGQLTQYRQAVWLLIARDLRQRFTGSWLGWLWLLLQPAFLLLVYTFVFGMVLRIRFLPESDTLTFALYLMAGLMPYNGFRESVERGASSLTGSRDLVQRVVFPPLLLPLVVTLSSLVTELVGLLILTAAVWLLTGGLSWWCLLLPVVMLVRLLLSLGVAWLVSILNVFLRDLEHLLGMLLTLLFFATPIIYPASMVPEPYRWVFDYNPFHYLVGAYRAVIIEGRPPDPSFLVLAAGALLLAGFGHWFFRRAVHRARDLL